MRDFPKSPALFQLEVEKAVRRMVHCDLEILRSDVIDSPNLSADNFTTFYLKDLELEDFICLALFSWYCPREIGITLRLDLETKLRLYSIEDSFLLKQFLHSEVYTQNFLLETTLWHSREFFGNILRRNLDRYLRLSPLRRKVKRVQRKRGYDDHGSRVPSHRWKPRHSDILTAKQNEIEDRRKSIEDTHSFLQGFLT